MRAGELIELLSLLPGDTPVVVDHRILSHVWLEKRVTRELKEPGACGECGHRSHLVGTGVMVDVPTHVGLSGRVVGPHFRDDPEWDPGLAIGGRWPRSLSLIKPDLVRRPR